MTLSLAVTVFTCFTILSPPTMATNTDITHLIREFNEECERDIALKGTAQEQKIVAKYCHPTAADRLRRAEDGLRCLQDSRQRVPANARDKENATTVPLPRDPVFEAAVGEFNTAEVLERQARLAVQKAIETQSEAADRVVICRGVVQQHVARKKQERETYAAQKKDALALRERVQRLAGKARTEFVQSIEGLDDESIVEALVGESSSDDDDDDRDRDRDQDHDRDRDHDHDDNHNDHDEVSTKQEDHNITGSSRHQGRSVNEPKEDHVIKKIAKAVVSFVVVGKKRQNDDQNDGPPGRKRTKMPYVNQTCLPCNNCRNDHKSDRRARRGVWADNKKPSAHAALEPTESSRPSSALSTVIAGKNAHHELSATASVEENENTQEGDEPETPGLGMSPVTPKTNDSQQFPTTPATSVSEDDTTGKDASYFPGGEPKGIDPTSLFVGGLDAISVRVVVKPTNAKAAFALVKFNNTESPARAVMNKVFVIYILALQQQQRFQCRSPSTTHWQFIMVEPSKSNSEIATLPEEVFDSTVVELLVGDTHYGQHRFQENREGDIMASNQVGNRQSTVEFEQSKFEAQSSAPVILRLSRRPNQSKLRVNDTPAHAGIPLGSGSRPVGSDASGPASAPRPWPMYGYYNLPYPYATAQTSGEKSPSQSQAPLQPTGFIQNGAGTLIPLYQQEALDHYMTSNHINQPVSAQTQQPVPQQQGPPAVPVAHGAPQFAQYAPPGYAYPNAMPPMMGMQPRPFPAMTEAAWVAQSQVMLSQGNSPNIHSLPFRGQQFPEVNAGNNGPNNNRRQGPGGRREQGCHNNRGGQPKGMPGRHHQNRAGGSLQFHPNGELPQHLPRAPQFPTLATDHGHGQWISTTAHQ
ncbi:RNA binding protein [Mycena indigotica]|uniref:RNA binding protein n=1 Tax=Mycena indigotica TaxID=2126181 RepID=A0A8H6W614_9AGAR|nr:RNA binding protein [Mycena indigotica]KAF7307109.1 RNA binding protein [Mycena indigotica]